MWRTKQTAPRFSYLFVCLLAPPMVRLSGVAETVRFLVLGRHIWDTVFALEPPTHPPHPPHPLHPPTPSWSNGVSVSLYYTKNIFFPFCFICLTDSLLKVFEVTSTETGITAGKMCPREKLSANKFKLCVADIFFWGVVVAAAAIFLSHWWGRVHETMVVFSRRHEPELAGFWGVWDSFFFCCFRQSWMDKTFVLAIFVLNTRSFRFERLRKRNKF